MGGQGERKSAIPADVDLRAWSRLGASSSHLGSQKDSWGAPSAHWGEGVVVVIPCDQSYTDVVMRNSIKVRCGLDKRTQRERCARYHRLLH